MPVIFQPGYKFLFRQTYTVAVAGALILGSVIGGSVYAGYRGFRYATDGTEPDRRSS